MKTDEWFVCELWFWGCNGGHGAVGFGESRLLGFVEVALKLLLGGTPSARESSYIGLVRHD